MRSLIALACIAAASLCSISPDPEPVPEGGGTAPNPAEPVRDTIKRAKGERKARAGKPAKVKATKAGKSAKAEKATKPAKVKAAKVKAKKSSTKSPRKAASASKAAKSPKGKAAKVKSPKAAKAGKPAKRSNHLPAHVIAMLKETAKVLAKGKGLSSADLSEAMRCTRPAAVNRVRSLIRLGATIQIDSVREGERGPEAFRYKLTAPPATWPEPVTGGREAAAEA